VNRRLISFRPLDELAGRHAVTAGLRARCHHPRGGTCGPRELCERCAQALRTPVCAFVDRPELSQLPARFSVPASLADGHAAAPSRSHAACTSSTPMRSSGRVISSTALASRSATARSSRTTLRTSTRTGPGSVNGSMPRRADQLTDLASAVQDRTDVSARMRMHAVIRARTAAFIRISAGTRAQPST
jgi:hypothetical protein